MMCHIPGEDFCRLLFLFFWNKRIFFLFSFFVSPNTLEAVTKTDFAPLLDTQRRYTIRGGPGEYLRTFNQNVQTSTDIKVRMEDRLKTFDALDYPHQRTAECRHWPSLPPTSPIKRGQMVRCYGFYSNKSRGLRKKTDTDNAVPVLIESELSSKKFHKNRARLIQKIYAFLSLLWIRSAKNTAIFI